MKAKYSLHVFCKLFYLLFASLQNKLKTKLLIKYFSREKERYFNKIISRSFQYKKLLYIDRYKRNKF